MSLEKNKSSAPSSNELETLPTRSASPAPVPSEPQSHPLAWQSGVGNSLLAAAATSGPPPHTAEAFPYQLGYGNAFVAHALIQRKAEGHFAGAAAAPPESEPGSAGVTPAISATTHARALIVDDTAETVGPDQMKKSQFLGELRGAVIKTTAEALAGSVSASLAAPYISSAFAQYGSLPPQQIEQSIRRDAPEAAEVTSARGFIPVITARVSRSVRIWVSTGEITGVPQGMPLAMSGVMGAVGSAVSGLAGAATGAFSGMGNAVSNIGKLFLKERSGGATEIDNPTAIQARLGSGQSLDGRVRSRMESAFGESFSGVEVHADSNAAGLSGDLNARAFTVGHHIAFGTGEYQPGTLIGDALIAHELAHVMQQRGGAATAGPAQKGTTGSGALEDDADATAVGAMVSAWGGAGKGLAKISARAMPSLKSGLRLQRCVGCGGEKRSLSDQTRDRDELSDLIGNPEANEAEVIKRIDALGSDAAELLMTIGLLRSDSMVNELAGSEAGQRILERVVRALRDGDLPARTRADAIARKLATRRAPPPLTPGLSQQQELDRINKAINADSRLAQYQDRALLVPLRLPVQLYQRDFEMSGGVYYDNSMRRLPPGDAGITIGATWSRAGAVQQSAQFPLNYIRLGPLALSYTDEYIRSTLWHEFQHYRRYLEFRQPDTAQAPESLSLEQELPIPNTNDRPKMELEATSIQLASDFNRLQDDEVQSILRYLAQHMDNTGAQNPFRMAAIERIRAAVSGNRAQQDRLLRLIGPKSVGRGASRQLNDLKQAIQKNLAPLPPKPHKGRPPHSR